jgi:hypothetical protein
MKGLLFFILSVLLLSTFVSAAPSVGEIVKKVADSVSEVLTPLLEPLLGTLASEYLYAKVLFLLIFFSLTYLVLGRLPLFEDESSSPFRWLVAGVIGILSVRFLSETIIIGLTAHYSVLGILFATLVPFVIYLYFLYTVFEDFPFLRRFAWGLFAAVYIGLWANSSSLSLSPGEGGGFNLGSAYGFTAFLAIALIFLDGWVHKRFKWSQQAKSDSFNKRAEIANVNAEIAKLEVLARTASPTDKKVYQEQIKSLTKHKHFLIKL